MLATSNRGKAAEYEAVLGPLGFDLSTLSEYPHLIQPEESAASFAGNARIKADYCYHRTGLASLADDSGLEVDALDGKPGVRSARLADTDPERIRRLLELIAQSEARSGRTDRKARFVCAICLSWPRGRIEVQGAVEGAIIDDPRGDRGFGYDPVFYYPPLRLTFAELEAEVKNRVSHRAQAIARLLEELERESSER